MTTTIPETTPYLDTAWRIGAQLCREAVWDGDRCNWLGDVMELAFQQWQVVHKSFAPELYGGTSGIALFLGQLHRFRRDPLLEATARGAVRQALSRIDDIAPQQRTALYSGWLGIAWALLHLAELLDEPAWAAEAERLAGSQLGADIDRYTTDVLGGSAGTILALLAIRRRTHRDALLDAAVRFGEKLLEVANRDGDTMSWTTLHPDTNFHTRDLTGYSHGTAGIALALLELATATGRTDFRDAAFAAFRYERKWYSPQHQNWPDFRGDPRVTPQPVELAYAVAWCHGAPGIGLARLRAFELAHDHELLAEADAAIKGTYQTVNLQAAADNYSLCHGLGGNAEIFLAAHRITGNPEYKAIAEFIGQRAILNIAEAREPWPCGVNGGGETPSLMLGLAGIGYFFLRLHDPEGVPSVLMIQ